MLLPRPQTPNVQSPHARRKSMFSSLFSSRKEVLVKISPPGIRADEYNCTNDSRLESAVLTDLWRSASSKVPPLPALNFLTNVARCTRKESRRGTIQ